MWGFTLHPHPKVSLLASGSEELQSLKRKLVETLIGHSFFFLLVEKASESQVAVKRPASLVQKAFHRLTKPRCCPVSGQSWQHDLRHWVWWREVCALLGIILSCAGFRAPGAAVSFCSRWLDGAGTCLCPHMDGTGLGSSQGIVLG